MANVSSIFLCSGNFSKLVSSGSRSEEPIGFSQACRIDNHIAVSGTAPIKDGQTVYSSDLYQQTKYYLKLSIKAIEEAGGFKKDIIRTRLILTDISQWKEAAKAHGELFSDIKPACTIVKVNRFIDFDWLIETEVDAVI